VQDYALAALRAAMYGSTAEQAIAAEVARLHATVRALGGVAAASPAASGMETLRAAPPMEADIRKGW
jgi:hypothetical protein